MSTRLDIFADITCPFTHIGLRRVVADLDGMDVQIAVRAWPLEWVNGEPLGAEGVDVKVAALRTQLGVDAFSGFDEAQWPTTTIPALNLAAAAHRAGPSTGLAVSLALRDAVFEDGQDVGDPNVLALIAERFGLDAPAAEPDPDVSADYAEGVRRGVRGSPDFWLGEAEFFCPALTLGHDDQGLTAEFDAAGLEQFLQQVRDTVTS